MIEALALLGAGAVLGLLITAVCLWWLFSKHNK